jgi:ankyrin repeat protein
MKKYLLILLIPIFSFCGIVDTASFSADFRQTVTNEFNKKITYTGNFQNDYKFTALMYAVDNGNLDISKLLIENGANIDVKSKLGETALDIASKHSYTDIVKLLKNIKNKK